MAEATSETDPKPASAPQEHGGYKDLFEGLLIALVVAFMARTFILEPFVIPTGSMAPTLLGAHMQFEDADSGTEWAVNYFSVDTAGNDVLVPDRALKLFDRRTDNAPLRPVSPPRPQTFPIVAPGTLYRQDAADVTAPKVHAGDRILVSKASYVIGDPARWDVAVFKQPNEPGGFRGDRYQQNYIKRIVGLPGDTLLILGGDLFNARTDKPIPELTPEDFRVEPKDATAQEVLWQTVYDHDRRPVGADRTIVTRDGVSRGKDPAFRVPWVGDEAWDLDAGPAGRSVRVAAAAATTLSFDADANGVQRFQPVRGRDGRTGVRMTGVMRPMFTDWLAFNVTNNSRMASAPADTYLARGYGTNDPLYVVTDVAVGFDYERAEGDGPLTLTYGRYGDTFRVVLGPDEAVLYLDRGDGEEQIARAGTGLHGGLQHVRLEGYDWQVKLLIDGEEVLATTPDTYAPDVGALLAMHEADEEPAKPTLSITAEAQVATLHHLVVERDIYYANRGNKIRNAIPDDFPRNVIRLGDDEYFALGDNSFISLDARFWEFPVTLAREDLRAQAGVVPRRFILGRAVFVYWPAAYDLPVKVGPLRRGVPNVGKMRLIR